MTLQCPDCVNDVKNKECFSDGLYCLIPPKDEVHGKFNISDEALLLEALYGRCVYELDYND